MARMKFKSEVEVAKDKVGLQTTPAARNSGTKEGEEEELVLVDDPRCLAVAMQALLLQTREEVEVQGKLIEVLKQIIATLKESLKDQERTKHKYKVHVKEAAKRKQGHRKSAIKAQDLAYKRCKEKDAFLTINPESMDRGKAERHEEKLRQARKTASAADLEYRHQVDRTVEAYGLWKTDMSESLNALQELEMSRLSCLTDLLNSYCMLASQTSQSVADSLNHLRNNRVAVLSVGDEIQLFIAKRQTGNCVPGPPRYHSYYVDEEMVRAGSIIAPVASSHERANEIVNGVRGEVERYERVESYGPARIERRGTVSFPEPVHGAREMSIASSRRESMQRELNIDRLERAMSQVSIGTVSRIQEPSPPRTPSPMQACPDGFEKRASILGRTSSPGRAVSMAPSMQSITARNAKPGARKPTMLATGFIYSDDDSDCTDAVSCVVESKPGRSAKKVPFRATALYDYTARNVDELSFREGDSISVTDCSDDPWWYGSVVGRGSGNFPSNYVNT